jgi:hypothetical protein
MTLTLKLWDTASLVDLYKQITSELKNRNIDPRIIDLTDSDEESIATSVEPAAEASA